MQSKRRSGGRDALFPEEGGESRPHTVIALAGNPNVGKSTIFNALTGMHQHTGNWPGKTVASAYGLLRTRGGGCHTLVDLPGTYSLLAHSAEEEVARNFLCFGGAALTVVVCDATCLERNLNLVFQAAEISPRVIVCVNLMDEARRKGIFPDLEGLEAYLGVPVVGTAARRPSTLSRLAERIDETLREPPFSRKIRITYHKRIAAAVSRVSVALESIDTKNVNKDWLSARMLEGDAALIAEAERYIGCSLLSHEGVGSALALAREELCTAGIDADAYRDLTVSSLVGAAEKTAARFVCGAKSGYSKADARIDRILTGRHSAYPVMLAFLCGIFFLTVYAANFPSAWLSVGFARLEGLLGGVILSLGAPPWLYGLLIEGVYRTLARVVSVMLPPMAIFFPLFTLLEDAGFLPRLAYDLDRPFRACRACGKQALTMCMGFGCNAAGVIGCRIVDSERERSLAVLTNSLVPCNGRFPMLITLLSLFFVGVGSAFLSALSVTLLLLGAILLSILVTLGATRFLSSTVLKGMPSSFTLELPPYRRPEIGRVLLRSLFDRTAFVLARAAAVAAPMGGVIWLLAHLGTADGTSLLSAFAAFLDPFGRLFGMDGVILLAFLLGFPANEIVIPLMMMIYGARDGLVEIGSLSETHTIFAAAGWTPLTVVTTTLFALFHFPCSTTLLTVRRETGSVRMTLLAFLLPLAVGLLLCFAVTVVWSVCGALLS